MKKMGIYLSLAVLLLEGVKLAVFIVMLTITRLQEGLQGIIALIANIMCFSFVSYKKIRRNRRKNRIHEELPLNENSSVGI